MGSGPEVANTLRAEGHDASEDGTGRQTLIPVTNSGDAAYSLCANSQGSNDATLETLIAFAENSRGELRVCGGDGQVSGSLSTGGGNPGQGSPCIAIQERTVPQAVETEWAVRRLLPVECERLMGFPDGWTQILWRGKPASECPWGPRYKALGNSWGVNCGEWVFDRLRMVEQIMNPGAAGNPHDSLLKLP